MTENISNKPTQESMADQSLNHNDFLLAVKKQRTLIRRLLSSRKHRSECIDDLVKHRYNCLVGKFFRPKGGFFRSAASDMLYYVCGVSADCDYIGSDRVDIILHCRHVCLTYQGCGGDRDVISVGFFGQSFNFGVQYNIEEIMSDMWVDDSAALEEMDSYYKDVVINMTTCKRA